MDKKYLVILSGSPRGGEKTWDSMFKYVIDYLGADLAVCTTEDYVEENTLFKRAKFKWILNDLDDFNEYYSEYFEGSWRQYLEKGKGYGLYESGKIHFALKDYIKRNYLNIVNKYDYVIYSRFDQYYVDFHPKEIGDNILIPEGENYFGVCDRHAAFSSKLAERYLSIVDYINSEESLLSLPDFPNCESVYLKHLEHEGLSKKIKRYKRSQFTAALKGEPTNWRVPIYRTFIFSKLMIKYPDEFIDSFNNKLNTKGLINLLLSDLTMGLTYFYLLIRRRLGS